MQLALRNRSFETTHAPLVMGILNVTPDSFSDAGRYLRTADAVARALEMIDGGADIIDIGPESTRPGSREVSSDEQIARAVPVIEAIREKHDAVPLSIDTRFASVASAAIRAGADLVNDTSALRDDPAMVDLVAGAGVPVVLMHRKGTPATMQQGGGPRYDDVVVEISAFLRQRLEFATNRGIEPSRIIFDPGIGFGKRVEHNLLILRHLDRFVALGQPLLLGASRKSVIRSVVGLDAPAAGMGFQSGSGSGRCEKGFSHQPNGPQHTTAATGGGRYTKTENPLACADPARVETPASFSAGRHLAGSLACVAMAVLAGAAIVRVHDIRETLETVRLCAAVRSARQFG